MRYRLALAIVAACVGGSSIAAHAQAPVVITGSPAAPFTGIGAGAALAGQLRAGTGGITDGRFGSATGGVAGTFRAGTGGIRDITRRAAGTGGARE